MSYPIMQTRRLLKKNIIELLKSGILVKKISPFESTEFEIPYEQIVTKKIIETKVSFGLLVFVLLFAFLGLLSFLNDAEITPLFFMLTIVLLVIALFTKQRIITIKSYDGQNIELYFNRKNKQDTIDFADTIINSANTFILNKFSKIDRDLPIDDQLSNLLFLRNQDLITEELFEQLKDQLLGRNNKKSIGYR